MTSLVLFSEVAPSPLGEELEKWGYHVYEALAQSEVLHLCGAVKIDAVVVMPGIGRHRLEEIMRSNITIQLEHGFRNQDVIKELSLLFSRGLAVQ
jgi:hypothetical protein